MAAKLLSGMVSGTFLLASFVGCSIQDAMNTKKGEDAPNSGPGPGNPKRKGTSKGAEPPGVKDPTTSSPAGTAHLALTAAERTGPP